RDELDAEVGVGMDDDVFDPVSGDTCPCGVLVTAIRPANDRVYAVIVGQIVLYPNVDPVGAFREDQGTEGDFMSVANGRYASWTLTAGRCDLWRTVYLDV